MADVKFKGNVIKTNGSLPQKGSIAPDFSGVRQDLSELSLHSLKGKTVILNVFPSLDTPVCAASVRRFNKEASALTDVVVLAISKDLPFAQGRFCTTEGIDKVIPLSLFRNTEFEEKYGMLLVEGALKGLFARGIVVVDGNGEVLYSEFVDEITEEPDYSAVLSVI